MDLLKSTAPKLPGRPVRLAPAKPNGPLSRSLADAPTLAKFSKAKSLAPPPAGSPRRLSSALYGSPSRRLAGGPKRPQPRAGQPQSQRPPLPLPSGQRDFSEGSGKQWEHAPVRGGKKRAAALCMTEVAEAEIGAEAPEAALSKAFSDSSSLDSSISGGEKAKPVTSSTGDDNTCYLANTNANIDGMVEGGNSDIWPLQTCSDEIAPCEEVYMGIKEGANTMLPLDLPKFSTRGVSAHSTLIEPEKELGNLSSKLSRTSQTLRPYTSSSSLAHEQRKWSEGGGSGNNHSVGQANGRDKKKDVSNGSMSSHTDIRNLQLWSNVTLSLPETLSAATCKTMSLYDVFHLDKKSGIWLVNEAVLMRCLDFIGLIGYEWPLPNSSSSTAPRSEVEMQGFLSSDAMSPSSILRSSPITQLSSNALPESSKAGTRPGWCLTRAASASFNPTDRPRLLFSGIEAERWLSEQEYVIGTILSCCAWSQSKVNEPYLVPHRHPIQQAATYVIDRFPHWGDASLFVATWEKQVNLVLGTAAPAHQRKFAFPGDNIIFSSDMEGGNLARVERADDVASQLAFNLWMDSDMGCEQRLWFRFAMVGLRPGESVHLRVGNIQPNTKLYMRNGMRPVWRAGNSKNQWTPVTQCAYRTVNDDADGEIAFVIVAPRVDVIHVAFCVPYTYGDLLCHISHWHSLVKRSAYGIRFEERVLCYTQDGRKLHLLVITSLSVKNTSTRTKRSGNEGAHGHQQNFFSPYTQFDTGKKVVLLSGRVHPGEVTASHGIHGAITFLLSRDPSALLLRDHFVFYVVPMLNPDGVSRGHSRLDQNGLNLNRCYNKPDPETQPTVNSLRKVFEHLRHTFRERFFMYIDFHSHASKSSGFMFGNFLPTAVQPWNMLFPKIVSIHAKDVFSFSSCRFGRGHMTCKEGSSRVLFGGVLIHSYTVELPHFTNNRMYVDGDTPRRAGPDGEREKGEDADDRWEAKYANTICSNRRRARPKLKSKPTLRLHETPGTAVKRNGAQTGAKTSEAETLRGIETPCILSQSAEIGRACLMALVDYCAIAPRVSPAYAAHGGAEKVLREVKRQVGSQGSTRVDSRGALGCYK